MKLLHFSAVVAALALIACAPPIENDPIYQQLKANPPTKVPARHVRVLETGRYASCDIFNEGDPQSQYMTCWRGSLDAAIQVGTAQMHYYRPYPSNPPRPTQVNETYLGVPVTGIIQLYR